ncbi:MAG: RagB/SusD family nutrient uptake outer membrane protein [Arachidicoccus sp.]|nr:RagB/SusD family nutrient uptake outer membrane protein [Arachidicoccus sp.]
MKATILLIVMMALIMACNKDFLDKKSSSSIVIPQTVSDFRAMLENVIVYQSTGALGQLASDEYYYLNKSGWQAATTATERQSYIWGKDVFGGDVAVKDWNDPYSAIFYANNVLDGLATLKDSIGNTEFNFVKGWAYFVRAYEYYDLVRNFSPAYDSATYSSDLGVPLKLHSGIDNNEARSSVKDCFDRILEDVGASIRLLPAQYPSGHPNQPSKSAAYGLLARIFLYMRVYDKAYSYADSALSLHDTLIDYNTLNANSNYPFANDNVESIYTTSQVLKYTATVVGNNSRMIAVDSNLLRAYESNDLRLNVYFRTRTYNNVTMRGGYYGTGLYPYTGLSVDEMFLIRAEGAARLGYMNIAVDDLNKLLYKRYRTGTYGPRIFADKDSLLSAILMERRKELIWRGLRWSDLKRLNREGANITLTRNLDGEMYRLEANSPNYVFNIPSDEIALSGITQNVRN